MNTKKTSEKKIGRVPALLVVQSFQEAFLCTISAEHYENGGSPQVHFSGGVVVAPEVVHHIDVVVVPLVASICRLLGVSASHWDIVIESIEAAAACETPLSMSGNSADLSLFLVLLSSALQLPLRQDAVATGLFTSAAGSIGAVGRVPEKLRAAMADSRINLFLHPPFGVDKSMDSLAPDEYSRIEDAIANARRQAIRLTPVKDIADLVYEILDDESIVLSSLYKGYFNRGFVQSLPADTVARAARHFLVGNQTRFWDCFGAALRWQEWDDATHLLITYLQFHDALGCYPSGIGVQMLQRLQALPPTLRHLLPRPLVNRTICFSIARHALDTDADDIQALLRANEGKFWRCEAGQEPVESQFQSQILDDTAADQTLDAIVTQLTADSLAKTVGHAIDKACMSFPPLESILAPSADAFLDVITSFYLHLLAETGILVIGTDPRAAQADAISLVDEAFHDQGGVESAKKEAILGMNGGLRTVINAMTDMYKAKAREKQIIFVLGTALDGMNRQAKVALMSAFLKRFGNLLPTDIAAIEPEDLVAHWKVIARAYARALDSLKNVIRRI